MAEQDKAGVWEQLLSKRAEWAAQQPALSAELKAMTREALKDVNNTLMQTFFGQPAGPGEPGTPLNPTPQIVTQELGSAGNYQAMLDGYTRGAEGREQPHERGMDR
jgi:hypothetical protein